MTVMRVLLKENKEGEKIHVEQWRDLQIYNGLMDRKCAEFRHNN